MKTVFVLNDPPYGTERCYNALRLAHALLKRVATAIAGCVSGSSADLPNGFCARLKYRF
jgi:hypothetical protein